MNLSLQNIGLQNDLPLKQKLNPIFIGIQIEQLLKQGLKPEVYIAYSPKYLDLSKESLKKVKDGEPGGISFFGGCSTIFGFYKALNEKIYLFQIVNNEISIHNE